MGWIGKVVGGGMGAALGGPIGAIIGVALGHSFDKQQGQPRQQDKVRVSYFVTLFSCFAKLAKADGRVSREEINHLERFMNDALHLELDAREFAIKIFNHAKNDAVPAADYLRQFGELINYNRELASNFLTVFYQLAMADGVLHPSEEAFLRQAEANFRLLPGTVDALVGRKTDLESAYKILECTPDMSLDEIKSQYREKCKAYHPDLLESKGLPPEFISYANDQLVKVNEAYDLITKHKAA